MATIPPPYTMLWDQCDRAMKQIEEYCRRTEPPWPASTAKLQEFAEFVLRCMKANKSKFIKVDMEHKILKLEQALLDLKLTRTTIWRK